MGKAMTIEAIIRLRKQPDKMMTLPIEVPELQEFVLAAHCRIDDREQHWLHGDGAFWKPVASLRVANPSLLRLLDVMESGEGIDYPYLHAMPDDAPAYRAADHDTETRSAIDGLKARVHRTARVAGGNLYKQVDEPSLVVRIDQGHFLHVLVGSDRLLLDGPNACGFSLLEAGELQELRRRIKPKGALPPMPEMLSPPASILMDTTASEHAFVVATRRWVAKEATGHRTGMLPIQVMRRMRYFLAEHPANGLALGALLNALEDGEVRARRRSENDTWFDGTAASLSRALLLARRRCEILHPHLLADVESDLADLLI